MWRQKAEESPLWWLLLFIEHLLLHFKAHGLAHAKNVGRRRLLRLSSFFNWCVHLLLPSFLFQKFLLPLTEELLELVLGLTGLNAGGVNGHLSAPDWVEIDLRFSRLFRRPSNWIILLRGPGDATVQSLLQKVLSSFSGLSPILQCRGVLAEGIVHVALRSGKQRVVWTLRALVETWGHFRLRILPNLSESVRFNPEETLLVGGDLALLLQIANREQEVAIIHRVFLASVDPQQVVPDVTPQTTHVVVNHARCLRNQLEVDCSLLCEVPVLLLGAWNNCAILLWLRIHHHRLWMNVVGDAFYYFMIYISLIVWFG